MNGSLAYLMVRRLAAVLTAMVAMLSLSIGPASAAEGDGHVYRSDILCTFSEAKAEDGDANLGYSAAKTAGDDALESPVGTYVCRDTLQSWPGGYLAVRRVYWKWNGSAWYVCREPDWHFNSGTAHAISANWDYQSLPCGRGFYGTTAHSYVKNGAEWLGGSIFSGANDV